MVPTLASTFEAWAEMKGKFMELFRKHSWIWKVIVVVSSLALIAASILPYLALNQ